MTQTKQEKELESLNDCQSLFKRSWQQAKEEGLIEELPLKVLCKGFFIDGYIGGKIKQIEEQINESGINLK